MSESEYVGYMPFSVIKKSKTVEDEMEIAGEFGSEADAQKFVEESLLHDSADEHEYMVEPPPSVID